MSWRLFWVGLFIVFAGVADSLLLFNEEIVLPDAVTKADEKAQDAMFGMRFIAPEREPNFLAMGFDDDEVKAILKQVGTLEEKYKIKDPKFNQIAVKIESTDDIDAMSEAFCGAAATIPVRYAAMPYLLKERDGQLKVVDVEEISSFERNEWAKTARIATAYTEADLTEDRKARKEDATRMVLAAVIARDEETLIAHQSPWGSGFLSGWSWEGVKKKHKGVGVRLLDYAALMHLVLETAHAEGGLCST